MRQWVLLGTASLLDQITARLETADLPGGLRRKSMSPRAPLCPSPYKRKLKKCGRHLDCRFVGDLAVCCGTLTARIVARKRTGQKECGSRYRRHGPDS